MSAKKIIVVSTRAPKAPLSGGMAPAVRDACLEFDEATWIALENTGAPSSQFNSANLPHYTWISETKIELNDTPFLLSSDSSSAYYPSFGIAHDRPKHSKRAPQYSKVENINIIQIPIDAEKWDGHYNKVANSEVWPLCHDRPGLAMRLSGLEYYGTYRVNEIMAKEIARQLGPDDTETPIWIHDYHHFSLPFHLREMGVKNPIVFFNHIPLPDPKMMDTLPEATRAGFKENLRGLLSCNHVNFQTAETAKRFMRLMGDDSPPTLGLYESTEFTAQGKTLRIGNFPISINPDDVRKKAVQPVETTSGKELAAAMVAPYIFINFERCDYSKGIKPRLLAFEKLLEENPSYRGRVQIVIGAEPTRSDIVEYKQYADEVREIIDRINKQSGWYCTTKKPGVVKPPVILLPKHVENADVLRLMRSTPNQTKIGAITPYRDGMNLTAKEFVAAQDPHYPGILLLSDGAGTAQELSDGHKGALSYNPDEGRVTRDPDLHYAPILAAMKTALVMPSAERQARHEHMADRIDENPLSRWAAEHKAIMTGHDSAPSEELTLEGQQRSPATHIAYQPAFSK